MRPRGGARAGSVHRAQFDGSDQGYHRRQLGYQQRPGRSGRIARQSDKDHVGNGQGHGLQIQGNGPGRTGGRNTGQPAGLLKKNADIAEENDGVTAEKIKFPLYVFPETMKTVDILYKSDNCSSRTEFMEKAIRFYCGYLLQNKPELVDYLAPQIATLTEGIVKGTEQRLSRALFKVAVELGAISHMLAAVHDIDDDTMIKLRAMCTDEVKRINGIINFEKAVRYQRSE